MYSRGRGAVEKWTVASGLRAEICGVWLCGAACGSLLALTCCRIQIARCVVNLFRHLNECAQK